MDIEEQKTCGLCGKPSFRIYSVRHDAYYCSVCRGWLERQCEDKSCEYCNKRPKKAPK